MAIDEVMLFAMPRDPFEIKRRARLKMPKDARKKKKCLFCNVSLTAHDNVDWVLRKQLRLGPDDFTQVPKYCTSVFRARWVCGASRCTNRWASATRSTCSSASVPPSWTIYKMPLTLHRPSEPDSAATAPSTAWLRSTETEEPLHFI